ncbi:MAG TPA: FTR1 family protein [Gemmatimonadales bacterium]|nr:FTR1 family protein [Gemmatimonadales bacterium]
MTLRRRLALIPVFFLVAAPLAAQDSRDITPTVRRLAASAQLGAQEYRVGVVDGQVVAKEEVAEARLFLTEARRNASLLPLAESKPAVAQIDSVLAMIDAVAPPDSVAARVSALAHGLSQRLGIELEQIPASAPALAMGARVYRENCASCHGNFGKGDGPAGANLSPPPANLTDAATLNDRSPLDFYQRITLGVAGTAMPSFESRLSPDDRWAAAVYATLLRLPAPDGAVPAALRDFTTTARMSDHQLAVELGDSAHPASLAAVAAVRSYQPARAGSPDPVFATVRAQLDSADQFVKAGQPDAASTAAFDAYMSFERVESAVRAKNLGLANRLEGDFAAYRTRAAGGATTAELSTIRGRLAAGLENAERTIGDNLSPLNLFIQSFILLVREGLEAILIVGALLTFLVKIGAGRRRRDIHIGVGAAVVASVLTAVLLEALFEVSPNRRELLEGLTMMVAVAVLFYVSYWLLSKMEVAKWNHFVKSKVHDAVNSGSALALASAAFLAVYREGFETVLFYKALFVSGGSGSSAMPVVAGILAGAVVLVAVYVAINRFGVRLPLKPFFAFTSAFLYYMAFVFAGTGIAELQEGGLVSTTIVSWSPRIPSLGIYPTVESLSAQGVLAALALIALVWTFLIEPRRRLPVTQVMVPEPIKPASSAEPTIAEAAVGTGESTETGARLAPEINREMIRSLERMEADLAELRAEVERMRDALRRAPNRPGVA